MLRSITGILALALLSGCGGGGDQEASGSGTAAGEAGRSAEAPAAPVVMEIVARGLAYEAPDQIPSGWTTFRFRNESEMVHFAVVERLPEGKTIDEHQKELAPVFQEGMNLLIEGKNDEAMAAFGTIPAWFSEIVFDGGPGLTSPGHTSEVVQRLEPGTYLLECYVKTNGIFHSYNPSPDAYGMVHEFHVTEEASGAPEPVADLHLSVSGEGGIEIAEPASAGRHTVQVRFPDQKAHENFSGHDVHLVRIADDTDLAALAAWMDWTSPAGLQTPSPAEFLGGLEEMPAGSTGYFVVTLDPGDYAWISEVPDPAGKGMLKQFTVPEGTGT